MFSRGERLNTELSNLNNAIKSINNCENIEALCRVIYAITLQYNPIEFGVRKESRISMERLRKEANAKAISLLSELPKGSKLTDEQRKILAAYTGDGGIGANEHEYYTPMPVAEGMWDLLREYGADTGNCLEPAAGTGVFHETKPAGVIMTATEISPISGRINQLLHPEDKVSITPFERLAASSPDGSFDSCVGNVPFGDSRGEFANLDPAYAKESNIGRYFILRLIDKVKAGGYICIVVPYGMTTGKNHKKLRKQVSRKAEFLGAHRLPSGTFEESGTSTAVDVWVLRKHPAELADRILEEKETLLEEANVLWNTFIEGRWYLEDGKRFVHGEVLQGFRGITIKNDQLSNGALKTKLKHKFDSRIIWSVLELSEPTSTPAMNGEQRLINDQWYIFESGVWVIDNTVTQENVSFAKFGVQTYEELKNQIVGVDGILSKNWDQINAIATTFPSLMSEQAQKALIFAKTQPEALRERVFRGSVLGYHIATYQDYIADSGSPEPYEGMRSDIARLVDAENKKYGSPSSGKISKVRGANSGAWLKFKVAAGENGELSALITGNLEKGETVRFNSADAEQVVRHLFSQVDLDPITLEAFREAYTGDASPDDNQLLSILSDIDGIAITPTGDLMPMDRATSGDIGLLNGQLLGAIAVTPDGPQKNNFLRQLAEIKRKRKWTDVDSIDFSLNSRWFDRSLILEFLRENGYSDLNYVEDVNISDGVLVSEQGYRGRNGVFAGYRYGTVVSRDKETGDMRPVYKRVSQQDPFLAQFENYLNGNKPRGVNAAQYQEQIKLLESNFNDWIRQHDEIGSLVQEYNDAFNAYIPFEQSDADLGLSGISGKRITFGYQNSEVRRLSEDGKGIMGFGTGLGKTTTALALEAFNFENGRTKRTGVVVPKAVYENWYYEACEFYSESAFKNILFVGIDEVYGNDGAIKQVPVLDEKGQPVINKHTGQPTVRNAITISDSATIKERMNSVPQSNYRMVVMTKEQYAKIPLREETIRDHAYDVLFAEAEAGRVNLDGTKHRDANKKSKILANASDTGSAKESDYPYFEDMGFDSVIADEGHNYRNSYSAGRESSRLAYLPIPSVAQSARDMAVKNAYLMSKNNGRGCVMLTATPIVNSPIDAFNMLSHIVPMSEWQRMGIYTPDDFVRVFGETATVTVQKLSGKLEVKEGLVGFKNLDGLRGIFHRWTSLKTSADVSNDVIIPNLIEENEEAPMSAEQSHIYEKLRRRAEILSNPERSNNKQDDEKEDSTFAIIRDMDRVCTDIDLYKRQMTFRFPAEYEDAIRKLVDDLPEQVNENDDDSDEEVTASVLTSVTVSDSICELVVPELFEKEVLSRLKKFGIPEEKTSHPITPKYSVLIEKLKIGYSEGGKQIIFTDEKSQHGKLKRIICSALGVKPTEIGILNATTVAEAGKQERKPKKVSPPKELKEDASEAQIEAYYTQLSLYEAYIASINEASLSGLESIAADYNEGRTPFIICNKKAEVGINLHKGTTDIHHLTLPWTPASINQRNGRGARVGSTQSHVRVHYYVGKGSFDTFRLETLKRKKDWFLEILTSDKARMSNADANDMVEMQLLLAANPEERERRIKQQMEEAKEQALFAAKKRAGIDLNNYLKAQHAAKGDLEEERSKLETLKRFFDGAQEVNDEIKANLDKALAEQENINEKIKIEGNPSSYRWEKRNVEREIRVYRDQLNAYNRQLVTAKTNVNKQERKIVRLSKAEDSIKRLRPVVKDAIDNNLLDVDPSVIDHGSSFYITGSKTFKIGDTFAFDAAIKINKSSSLSRIEDIDFDTGIAVMRNVYSSLAADPKGGYTAEVSVLELREKVSVSEDEVSLRQWMLDAPLNEIHNRLTKKEFVRYLKEGAMRIRADAILYVDGDSYHHKGGTSLGHGYVKWVNPDWLSSNADLVVYPDPTDDVLKTAIAKWVRSTNKNIFVESYLKCLFGDKYKLVINEYGDHASESTIAEFIANGIASISDSTSDLDYRIDGSSEKQVIQFVELGNEPYQAIDDLRTNKKLAVPPNYRNQEDFEIALNAEIFRLKEVALANAQKGAKQLGVERFKLFKATLAEDFKATFLRFQKLLTESYRSTIRDVYHLRVGRIYHANCIDGPMAFADAVSVGLLDASSVTPELLINPSNRGELVDEISSKIDKLEKEGALSDFRNQLRVKAGEITQEDIDRANAKKEEEKKQAEESKAFGESGQLIIKKNTTHIKAKWGINFVPDGCYGLQDPKAKSGSLFRAKDDLKEMFNAKFYNGKNSTDEFAGCWWLISTKYSIEEIMTVINRY